MLDSKSIEKMSFESALAELEEIVKGIDSGQQDLADAVKSFERGVLLKKHCQLSLKKAKMKIEKISDDSEDTADIPQINL